MRYTLLIKSLIAMITLFISLLIGTAQAAPVAITELLSGQLDITINVYPAKGKDLVLWIAAGRGFKQRHHDIANKLSKLGIEVWLADIRDALFLSEGNASIRKLDGQYTAELIERAGQKSKKNIVLMGHFGAAIPVLRGAHKWQELDNKKARLTGAILFSPNLFASVPALGIDPEYLPEVKATNIPIMIYQGTRHHRRWHLQSLLENMRQGGSTVYFELLKDVTAIFYDKDNTKATLKYLKLIPDKIKHTINLLAKSPMSITPVALHKTEIGNGTLDIKLKPYKGNPVPQPITLYDINSKLVTLDDYKGKVTVINFWATWCPPCVVEIPSLNNLRKAMENENFQLISVNFAEEKDIINKFLGEVNVHFPVLLDHDGKVSSKWKVFAFPSTFVIGPDARIHYGVNAAIYWDSPEVINTLKQLARSTTAESIDHTSSSAR